jgi:hypothetical protein
MFTFTVLMYDGIIEVFDSVDFTICGYIYIE